MAWLAVDLALPINPKTLHLSELMGWSPDETVGRLLRLWGWCLNFAPDGDLRKFAVELIAQGIGLPGSDGERLRAALLKSGWVEGKPYFRIHDWWGKGGMFLKGRYSKTPKTWKRIRKLYAPPKRRSSHTSTRRKSGNQVRTCSAPAFDQIRTIEEKMRRTEEEKDPLPPPPAKRDDEDVFGKIREEVLERTPLKRLSPADERELSRLVHTHGMRALEACEHLHSGIVNATGYLRVILEGKEGPDAELERFRRLAHSRGLG
jgi:hypothetical protein